MKLRLSGTAVTAAFLSLNTMGLAQERAGAPLARLRSPVPAGVAHATKLRHADPNRVMHVAISLPYRDPEGAQRLADAVSDPRSPMYRQYLTPEEVGARFGPTEADLAVVSEFASSHGFRTTLVSKNGLAILADCTVAQAEAAFHTTIDDYRSGPSNGRAAMQFTSFSTPLQVPAGLAPKILDVSGLETYTRPRRRALTPTQTRTLYGLATTYNGGSKGQGRTVGISNWDPFDLANVNLFASLYGLPAPVGGVGTNITVTKVSGGSGDPANAQGEADLDIQMILGQAPLCNLIVYDGNSTFGPVGVLTKEASDNKADIISESWGWDLPASIAASCHNQHLSMTLQGITYMAASGDNGTDLSEFDYPDYDPEVLMVGGSSATTDGAGQRISEVAWDFGGSGWCTSAAAIASAFNTLPSWQKGSGVPTTINKRLVPDLAGHAGGLNSGHNFFYQGFLTDDEGTSFSCPVFAGGLAVAEQELMAFGLVWPNASGKMRLGRLQDLIYAQNGKSTVWYDIVSGSTGVLPDATVAAAKAQWDFATGWGAINWSGFLADMGGLSVAPTAVAAGTAATAKLSFATAAPAGTPIRFTFNTIQIGISPAPTTLTTSSKTYNFTVNTSNGSYSPLQATISAYVGAATKPLKATLTVNPWNNAVWSEQTSFPSTMIAGQSYPIYVEYLNAGKTTWDRATHRYRLAAVSPFPNTNWGPARLELQDLNPVPPGAYGIFKGTLIAPIIPGSYTMQWQPIQDDIGVLFGSLSPKLTISVVQAADGARYISGAPPTTVNAGSDFTVPIQMLNVGANSWNSNSSYYLTPIYPSWNVSKGFLSLLPVTFGTRGTINLKCTAPVTPGPYHFQWQMMHYPFAFGDKTPDTVVQVVQAPYNAQFVSQNVPTSVGPGRTFTASVTMKNVGNLDWPGSFNLVSQNPRGNANWGVASIPLGATLLTSQSKTFSSTFTAPTTPGTYNFQWRMDNGAGFGQYSPNVVITVSADASRPGAVTAPLTVPAGSDFVIQVPMTNTGTTTWTNGAGYYLASQSPANNLTWGINKITLSSLDSIAPGGVKSFSAVCTAPIFVGTYTLQWQMSKGGAFFGQPTTPITIQVVAGGDNAQFISQSVPTGLGVNQSFTASITMKNIGGTSWDALNYSLAPVVGSWGVAKIASGSVISGNTYTFTTTFKAPSTPGLYHFQWRMQHGTVKFGQKSNDFVINVTPAIIE